MSDARKEHDSLALQRDMRVIVNVWPDLMVRLAGGGGADRSGVHVPPSSRPPIDAHVSDVVNELAEWVVFLARVLMDEVTVQVPIPGPVKGTWAEPWRPAGTKTPVILADIATWRVGHFTEHDDEMLRISIADDAARLSRLALRTARPSGRRKIRLGIPCVEFGTSAEGARVTCAGQYTTILDPEDRLGDMVCTKDEMHRMTPLEWQRGQRRGAMDEGAMRDLVNRVLRVGGSGA